MAEEKKEQETVEAEPVEKKPKKSKKNEEAEKLKEELGKTKDLLSRTAAEFDNFKKRTERERLSVAEFAKASMFKDFLPVLDNAYRALSAQSDSEDYSKGLEMIIKQFIAIPEKMKVTELAKVGDEFDPNCHEAVMHVEDGELGENVIAEVLQQGYKIGDTVIRVAMVKVAN
ncbi:MAG: nucleotide exchange factor GrpE [Acutalibacteraceae bacterium]|nr:nucleotide exchange factor GrpE [Acutalibacteraceae bacterium]